MQLRDGVEEVRSVLSEGNPWLYDDNDIIRHLNYSARNLVQKTQAIRSTYRGQTVAPIVLPNGSIQGTQEYQMPLDCDQIIQVKVQIGLLMPIVFACQELLQTGAYVSSLPLSGYVRRGLLLTGQVPAPGGQPPVTPGSSEVVLPAPTTDGQARWIVGFQPVPSQIYPFFVDYYAYHPQMLYPLDTLVLPDTMDVFNAWVAYPISRGMLKRGDLVSAQQYQKQHDDGVTLIQRELLKAQWQINPPQYGGNRLDPMINRSPQIWIIPPTNVGFGN